MKTCKLCGKNNSETPFPKWGFVCKKCQSIKSVQWAKDNPERKLESNKKYLSTSLGSLAIRKATKRFRKKFPEKYSAYVKVQTAVRNGTLKRLPCEICGNAISHGHHDDYKKPLDVKWLCDICHVRLHRSMLESRTEPKG